jgi:hypothetical protein
MPVVRELTAKLGFQADTTGATRFDSAVNRSRANLKKLDLIRLDRLQTKLKTFFAATGIGVVAAGTALATKKFTDIETSLEALQFATKESFGGIKEEIDSILEDKVLKNLVDEIDLVDAALAEAQKGVSGTDITKFLRLATSLSIVTKKSVSEVLGLITGFVGPEADLGILKLLGELPQELQELLKFVPGPGQAGLIGRREKVLQELLAVAPELEKNIIEQRKRGLLTFKEFGGAFEKLTLEIGERSLPAFTKLNDILIPVIERLTEFAKPETPEEKKADEAARERRREFFVTQRIFPESFGKPIFESAKDLKVLDKLKGFNVDTIFDFLKFTIQPKPIGAPLPGVLNNRGGDTVNKITVTVQPGEDRANIGVKIAEEIGRKLGSISEQTRQSTRIRGGQ